MAKIESLTLMSSIFYAVLSASLKCVHKYAHLYQLAKHSTGWMYLLYIYCIYGTQVEYIYAVKLKVGTRAEQAKK